ncbi:MAG: electron transfer flavoprotein-ubiquinone oxidoreductase [Devosia sp.]|nr:electron transfer flavoprotein-ubiquinone oxidoreductase [Devosia sp.]
MEFDVVIVGAGPSGLASAIRLKQINPDLKIVVIEKAAEVGAHSLSGAVIDPAALDRLLPDWRNDHGLGKTSVTQDRFSFLTRRSAIPLPGRMMPKLMSNHGNFIVSLGKVCKWLAEKAETMGVEIYPGFAASEVLFNDDGAVTGIATGDMGITKNREPGPSYERGMALLGRYVLLAEGVRGSLSRQVIARFGLAEGVEPQKYGIGLKELWEVSPANHKPGLVRHSFGWPLDNGTGGGGFLYHMDDNQVVVGFVVHLNYRNPYLSPFEEFQRFKSHPAIRGTFKNATRIAYGSRAISEGGYQSVPQLAFPGGLLVGDSAGFVNVPRIKGIHNAVISGMLAAEHVARAIAAGRGNDAIMEMNGAWRESTIGRDLKPVRNIKPLWSRFGTLGGILLGGFDMWCHQLFGRSLLGTLGHGKSDHEALEPAARHAPIDYPKPDGTLTFDRLSSVFLSGTNHKDDQPVHLKVADPELQKASEFGIYAGPSARYCPAGVYEWVQPRPGGEPVLVINAQNCVHCKTCDIKDPNQNITWVPPEGGGGPNYSNM